MWILARENHTSPPTHTHSKHSSGLLWFAWITDNYLIIYKNTYSVNVKELQSFSLSYFRFQFSIIYGAHDWFRCLCLASDLLYIYCTPHAHDSFCFHSKAISVLIFAGSSHLLPFTIQKSATEQQHISHIARHAWNK